MAKWHSMTLDEIFFALGSAPQGLSSKDVIKRLDAEGANELQSPTKPSPVRMFLGKFRDTMVLVLIFASIVSLVAGESTNAYAIMGIILLVATIGFIQEYKAESALEALREMLAPMADVFRDGKLGSIPARELVSGDVVYLEAGDRVPADCRVIEENALQINEAHLTGESLPVKKNLSVLPDEAPLADRSNMLFMGSIVSSGNCRAIVVGTGARTELGKISGLIRTEKLVVPLKAKLEQLARRQAMLVFIVSTIVFILDTSRGSPIMDSLISSIALAVAGVPEALPFVVTLALAYGTRVMAGKKAIIRSLPAVETLGSTTVICTDKTGTLTAGEMTVREIQTFRTIEVTGAGYDPAGEFLESGKRVDPGDEDLKRLLLAGLLCNNSTVENVEGIWNVVGDPTEGALVVAALKARIPENGGIQAKRIAEIPFSSERRRMTTLHELPDSSIVVSMKGAPEVVVDRCKYIIRRGSKVPFSDEERLMVLSASNAMASRALRLLAFAYKSAEKGSGIDEDSVESDMIFLGLAGIMDPPRPEAKEAIRLCRQAGIRPIMITGDHRLTAEGIAKELGIGQGSVMEGSDLTKLSDTELEDLISETSVFARVTAEDKVRIVKALKSKGHIVAMTGDGVNDAPALKAADIGVAMGKTGTEVAKEASDMVIADDNFATIVEAVKEGRRIYDNIQKGSSYLLAVSFAEVATILFALLLGYPIPLLALQILWVNVVAEEFPAIGLALDPAHFGIMNKKPRDPNESMPRKSLLLYTVGIAAMVVLGTLSLFVLSIEMGYSLGYARTEAFAALGFFTVFLAYSSRSMSESIIRMNPFENRVLILGMLGSIVAILFAIYIPFAQALFETVPLSHQSLGLIIIMGFLITVFSDIMKRYIPGTK